MNVKPHKQSMSELKLRRLTEHNQRLKEDLERPRIRVSEASQRESGLTRNFPSLPFWRFASLINYCKSTRDYLVPSVWGPVSKGEDPYAPAGGGCNCVAM
ncbi:hypothetical protein [Sporisorium scitamineum]|uniref:G protein gamma domain-containing protein n=1 Tax=Sporisorium scitamineum TaxID=49012 RepID=A0A0F7SD62_9BASI|nr:hypothetical protein [Sporisorium scitamineum]